MLPWTMSFPMAGEERPPIRPSLGAIVSAAYRPDVTIAEIGRVADRDASFSTALLRLVNSSVHARETRVSSVRRAAALLGIDNLRIVALIVAGNDTVKPRNILPLRLSRFWELSLRRAVAAQLIVESKQLGLDRGEAFVAGLLQDIGVLPMLNACPDRVHAWFDRIGEPPARLLAREQRLFEAGHDEVGARLASDWGLPREVVETIRHHHDAESAPEPFRRRCEVAAMAESVAAVYSSDDKAQALETARTHLRDGLGLGRSTIDDLIGEVGSRVSSTARALALEVSIQPTLRQLLRAAERCEERMDLSRRALVKELNRATSRTEELERELARMREFVAERTGVDELTGLSTEHALQSRFAFEARRAARTGKGLSVMSLVLTAEGGVTEEMEQALSIALGETLRDTDLVARIEPGEFEMVLADTAGAGAIVAARRAIAGCEPVVQRFAEQGMALWAGVASVMGSCTADYDLEELGTEMRGRARMNAQAARNKKSPITRTGHETMSWPLVEADGPEEVAEAS